MSTNGRILQINFKYGVPRADYEAAIAGLAQPIADVPGLRWKIWILNEAENEAGGHYLFDSAAAVDAYLKGPIVAGIVAHPALRAFSVKQFDVLPDVTRLTRGPA